MITRMILLVGATFWPVAAHASDLDGHWLTNCAADSSTGGADIFSYDISGDAATQTQTAYSDASCATAAYTVQLATTFTLGSDTQIAGAQSIDETVQSVSATVTSDQYVSAFNQQQICGISNWVVNQPQDISGKPCGENGATMPKAGDKFYDVVKTSAATDGSAQLFFGDSTSGDGSAPAKRPTALDTNDPYHKG